MARLAGHLAAKGIRAAAWEEATRGANGNGAMAADRPGGIGHDALIFSWTGQGAGVEAARRGHDVVMCPGQNTYLDMAHSDGADDWGANWAAFIGLEDTVDWQVVPEAAPDIADRIAGVQGCFWGEFTTEDRQMEAMLAPRLLGVACKAWEADETTDGPPPPGPVARLRPALRRHRLGLAPRRVSAGGRGVCGCSPGRHPPGDATRPLVTSA